MFFVCVFVCFLFRITFGFAFSLSGVCTYFVIFVCSGVFVVFPPFSCCYLVVRCIYVQFAREISWLRYSLWRQLISRIVRAFGVCMNYRRGLGGRRGGGDAHFIYFFVWFPSFFVFSVTFFRFSFVFFYFSFRFLFGVSLLLLCMFTIQVSRPFPFPFRFTFFFRDFCNFSLHIYSGSAAGFLAGGVLRGGEKDLLQRRVFPSLHRRYLRGRRGPHLRVVRGTSTSSRCVLLLLLLRF